MKIEFWKEEVLRGIPSASGIVKLNQHYYVIGDDSLYLYQLDSSFRIENKFSLVEENSFDPDQRIPKKHKTDLEAMEAISGRELIILGSGSKSPERDAFFLLQLNGSDIGILAYSLTPFYDHVRSLEVLKDSELNIEAVSYFDQNLLLFNRKKNLVLEVNYKSFLDFVMGRINEPPGIRTNFFQLPIISGVEAGFSGATCLPDKKIMLLTASVEDTQNAYDDGAVLGSYIGVFDLNNYCIEWTKVQSELTPLKIESLTIDGQVEVNNLRIVMVADNDTGESVLIRSTLSLK